MNKIRLLKLWEKTLQIYPNTVRKNEIKRIIEYIKQDI